MIGGLLKVSGMVVLRLVYGKEAFERFSGKIGLMLCLSVANIFWLMSLLFLFEGISANDTILCLIISIGYPIAVAIWAIVERRKK